MCVDPMIYCVVHIYIDTYMYNIYFGIVWLRAPMRAGHSTAVEHECY